MDSELFRQIKILALKSVEAPDWDAFYRQICRWFSREFSTPLLEVEKLSEIKVLQAYFEDLYEKLKAGDSDEQKEQYKNFKESIISDPKETVEEEESKEDADEAWVREMNEVAKKEMEARTAKLTQGEDPVPDPNLIDTEESFSLAGETPIDAQED